MEQYKINDLERLTGIKAHTLRIWEKRYDLITPFRTATNRRYYSPVQLKKLMNVVSLLAQGRKISEVAELTDDELKAQIEGMHHSSNNGEVANSYIKSLTEAMLDYNETGFERVFSAAVTRFGFQESMMRVFYPFMIKTGLYWSVEKLLPVQEHFASCIIRRKLIAATDGLVVPHLPGKRVLLFLPAGEWHEIGLLFANFLLRQRGYDTVYLGQDLPDADLNDVLLATKPWAVLTFYIAQRPPEEVKDQVDNISKNYPETQIWIGGNPVNTEAINFSNGNIKFLKDVEALLSVL